jgi:hypothetical protein
MAGCSEQGKENYLAPYVRKNLVVRCENVCLFNTTPTHEGNVVPKGNNATAVIRYFGHNRYEAPGHTSSSCKHHHVKSEFKSKDLEIYSICQT